jgi:hypothetical protein
MSTHVESISLQGKEYIMSLIGGLFHALTNPLETLMDPVGTFIKGSVEDSIPKPEDIK